MKARIKATGKIVDIISITDPGLGDKKIYQDTDRNWYRENELDFTLSEPEEEVIKIHGWVAIDEAYDSCFLHTSKPHQVSQGIADTGDYNAVWESDGETYLLDKGLFSDMNSDSDPVECEVTIIIKPKKQ